MDASILRELTVPDLERLQMACERVLYDVDPDNERIDVIDVFNLARGIREELKGRISSPNWTRPDPGAMSEA